MSTPSYIGQAALEKKMKKDLTSLKLFNVLISLLFLLLLLVPITHVSGSDVSLMSLLVPSFWTSLFNPFELVNFIQIAVGLIVIAYPITAVFWLLKSMGDIEFYRPRVATTNLIFITLFAILYGVYYSQGWITLTTGLFVQVTLPIINIVIPSVPSLFVSAIILLLTASLGNSIIGENLKANRKIVAFQMLALLLALGGAVSLFVPFYVRTDTLPILGYDLFSVPGAIYHANLELMLTANAGALAAIETIGMAVLNTLVILIVVNVLVQFLTLVLGKPIKWLSILFLSLLLIADLTSVYFALTYFEIWPTNVMNFLGTIIVTTATIAGMVVVILGVKRLDDDRYPTGTSDPAVEVPSETPSEEPVVAKKPAKPYHKLGLIIVETVLALLPIGFFFYPFFERLGTPISVFDFVVFGTITNADVITMFAANAGNWPLASIIDFATVAQYTLITLVVLFDLNILIRLLTWLTRRPLRILSMVWSIITLVVVGVTFYLSFTYFEIYWNQPLTYVGLIASVVLSVIHLLIAVLSKPHKSKVDAPVADSVVGEEQPTTETQSEHVAETAVAEEKVEKLDEAIKPAPVKAEEPVKKSAPLPLPTVELESLNVFGEAAAPATMKAAPQPVIAPKQAPAPEAPKPTPEVAKPVEPIAEPIRVVPQPEPKPVATGEDDEVEAKPISFVHANGVDSLYQELNDAEKAEFRKFYIDPGVDHKVPYLQYVVGGDNSQYFSNVFYYMSRYRKIISIGLLTKIYEHIRAMLGDDYSEISHLNTQLIRIYFSRRSEPGVMKLLISKCKEDIELNLNVLKVHDVYLYSFKRLVMVHEGMGNYTEAKRWVEMALELNLDDKTKGGYPARLERIKSKIQLYTDN